jgi:hypothetical protein
VIVLARAGMEGPLTPPGGLCVRCVHVRSVTSGKGSTFLLCGKSATDPRFPKYPALPVLRCAGFTPADASGDQGSQT